MSIEGGTHVKASPCFDFLKTTWQGYLGLMGVALELRLHRHGFYPRDGGLIEASIQGANKPHALQIDHTDLISGVVIRSAVAGLPESIARRQGDRARRRLENFDLNASVHYETWQGGPGTMLAVELPTQPVPTLFFGLGERGKPSERVADEAVDQVIAFLRAKTPGVDSHSADQMLLPLALASESSQFKVAHVSQHLLTNVATIKRFVDREIVCEGKEGKDGTVRIA